MIPKRIKMAGFLSYREEQSIAFDGASLWMLAGLNGSGKSTVFDAVTFALFGHHRGGSSGAGDLITKGENGFNLEFDFALDGKMYRAKRTLKKRASSTASSQQLSVWQENGSGDGVWEPIADTHMKAKYDEWIREHIGLNYETFTSSVLLLQGRAEKLLDSTAKGRAEVLASIVDLDRYQKLYDRADSQRKSWKGQVDALTAQWNGIPEVTAMETLEIENRIEDAAAELQKIQVEFERLQTLEFQSGQWAEIQNKLRTLQQRQRQAEKLVRETAAIESDIARLRELRDVLPHLETIFLHRTNRSRSEDATKELTDWIRTHQQLHDQRENDLMQERRKRVNHLAKIAELEQRIAEIHQQRPVLTAILERVNQIDHRAEEVAKMEAELARLPRDLEMRVQNGQTRLDELNELSHVFPQLNRFFLKRGEFAIARNRNEEFDRQEKSVQQSGEKLRDQIAQIRPQLESATNDLRRAETEHASTRAILKEAVERMSDFDSLDAAKLCRTCGQALTPQHFAEEKARREKERVAADLRCKAAAMSLKTAQAQEKAIRETIARLETEIQTARDQFKDARNASEQAKKECGRLAAECNALYAELPDAYRLQIAREVPPDWDATTYPTEHDLGTYRQRVAELKTVRQELERHREEWQRCKNLTAQLQMARATLADLRSTLNDDPADLRRRYHALEAEAKSINENLTALKRLEVTVSSEIEKIAAECQTIRESLTERHGRLQTEAEKRRMSQAIIEATQKLLPSHWVAQADQMALTEFHRLRSERGELEKQGVEARADDLRKARIELESLNQTLAELAKDEERLPLDARRETSQIQSELQSIRKDLAARTAELNQARNDQTNLADRARRRQTIHSQLQEADREWNRFKLLAELLGRDRLQRHLVRQAERQIVDYANGVLDRLSSGQMMLRLCGTDDTANAEKALELECFNRATGQSPINVAFLSGSQRFRVAVSLALGIGQYASRQHRPIESVIIDEGFGCLDRQGRQVMVQELQNLRGHLQCIMLVSHQDEFADAFANGYRFELSDGSTKVTRFHR